jgi:peptidoglycan/LPS O-acetylase OafA/YrhL
MPRSSSPHPRPEGRSFPRYLGKPIKNGALPHAQSQRFYRPELDAMRFFAFLCVFFHHTLSRIRVGGLISPYPIRDVFTDRLKYAVSLFFLLSGYLITTARKIEHESMGKVELRPFKSLRENRLRSGSR